MKENIKRKLKSNSGESIAETLVAVLIAAFALLMLAGTINTASNLITNSKSKLKDYYDRNNVLAAGTSSDGSSGTVRIHNENTAITCSVTVFNNNTLGSMDVVAYRQ